MGRNPVTSLPRVATWTCRQCQLRTKASTPRSPFHTSLPTRELSTSSTRRAELETVTDEIQPTGFEITAAPPIDFGLKESKSVGQPARLVPASASYFTTSPIFNDHILRLTKLARDYEHLPTLPSETAPRMTFMTLAQFRSAILEKIGAAKYARLLGLLKRLNQIDPKLRPPSLQKILEEFRRPGSAEVIPPRPKTIDQYGRALGVGRRKASVARVQLIEGNGEVMVNGQSISQVFPRLHDRESAVWPLKVTSRLDKYNVFVMVNGGGSTGQAESITLAVANALMVHEPALKPTLRKGKYTFLPGSAQATDRFQAGCVTRNMKRVERKKTGRVKARKRPTWVKR